MNNNNLLPMNENSLFKLTEITRSNYLNKKINTHSHPCNNELFEIEIFLNVTS